MIKQLLIKRLSQILLFCPRLTNQFLVSTLPATDKSQHFAQLRPIIVN